MKNVGVIADVQEHNGYVWHCAAQTYLNALLRVSAVRPLIIPSLPQAVDGWSEGLEGLVLTGVRTNVHPSRYGEEETPEHAPFDHARDGAATALVREAVAGGVPILALCRGFQEMVVAWGGALTPALHEMEGRFDHRAPASTDQDVRFGLAHAVIPEPGGRLAALVGEAPFEVNSLHRQGVTRLGEGLLVEARAPDGTIEAVSVAEAPGFALAVQWHPEYWAETDGPSRAIFEAFGDAVRRSAGS